MSSNLHPMLNVAIKAARAAGAIINRAALDIDLSKAGLAELDQAFPPPRGTQPLEML